MGGGEAGHVASEPPSLLSSFAGILESGVLNVFSSVADKGGSSSRVNSVHRARDHPAGDLHGTSKAGPMPSGVVSKALGNAGGRSTTNKHHKLAPIPSDTSSESDMPGLERLERSTCEASSEDEARSEVGDQ